MIELKSWKDFQSVSQENYEMRDMRLILFDEYKAHIHKLSAT